MHKVTHAVYEKAVVSVRDIDTDDCAYQTHAVLDDESLGLSVEKYGLLHPVVLVQQDAQYSILQGFRRVHVLKKKTKSAVPAFVLSGDGVSRKDLFLQAVHANIGQVFSDADRLLMLEKAKNEFGFTVPEIVQSIAGVLSMPQSLKVVGDYLHCATVHDCFKERMRVGQIGYKGMRCIASFSCEDQIILFRDIFRYCSLSASDVKSLCENIEIICRRDEVSLKELFRTIRINAITKNKAHSPKNKANMILQLLQACARPCITTMRKKFVKVMNGIALPKNVHVQDPGEFERSMYTLSVAFSSSKELRSAVDSLSQQSEKFQLLFDLDKDVS